MKNPFTLKHGTWHDVAGGTWHDVAGGTWHDVAGGTWDADGAAIFLVSWGK